MLDLPKRSFRECVFLRSLWQIYRLLVLSLSRGLCQTTYLPLFFFFDMLRSRSGFSFRGSNTDIE